MSDTKVNEDGLEVKSMEPQADNADVTENLRVKLKTINNELQETMKVVDNYKEDKRLAEKSKTELEKAKKKISDLETRLSNSESNSKRYRNERNTLRNDIARLINERKQMISYEQDVQKLKREIEMQKSKYDQNNSEWRKKQTDTENRYDELIKKEKQKTLIAEQEVQRLMKEHVFQKNAYEENKKVIESKQKEFEVTHDDTGTHNNAPKLNEAVTVIGKDELKSRNLEESSNIKRLDNLHRSRITESFTYDTEHEENGRPGKASEDIVDVNTSEGRSMKEKESISTKHSEDNGDSNNHNYLAQGYNELYTHQWPSAYEQIRDYFGSEEETVQALLDILEDIMNFCKGKANGQIDDLYRVLTFSLEKEDEHVSVKEKITKHLKECMREVPSYAQEYLYQTYSSTFKMKSSQYVMNIESFVKECFELSWLMVIQDPQVVLFPVAKPGVELDEDVYKPYKNAGRYVKYTVWPAMLLHENGPVLAIGVAEGQDDKPRVKEIPNASDKSENFSTFDDNRLSRVTEHDDKILLKRNIKEGIAYKDDFVWRNHKNDERDFIPRKGIDNRRSSAYETPFNNQKKSVSKTELQGIFNNDDWKEDFVSSKNRGFVGRDDFNSRDQENVRRRSQRAIDDDMPYDIVSPHEFKSKFDNGDMQETFALSPENNMKRREEFLLAGNSTYGGRNEIETNDDKATYGRENFNISIPSRSNASTEHMFHNQVISATVRDIQTYADVESHTRTHTLEEASPTYSQSTILTKSRGTTNVWKPAYGFEREPTADEMRLYLQYVERYDHTGARDVLGHAAYMRCLRNDHKRHLYY